MFYFSALCTVSGVIKINLLDTVCMYDVQFVVYS